MSTSRTRPLSAIFIGPNDVNTPSQVNLSSSSNSDRSTIQLPSPPSTQDGNSNRSESRMAKRPPHEDEDEEGEHTARLSASDFGSISRGSLSILERNRAELRGGSASPRPRPSKSPLPPARHSPPRPPRRDTIMSGSETEREKDFDERPPSRAQELPPSTSREPQTPYNRDDPPPRAYTEPPYRPPSRTYDRPLSRSNERPRTYDRPPSAYAEPPSRAYERPPSRTYERPASRTYERPPSRTTYVDPPSRTYDRPPSRIHSQLQQPYEDPPPSAPLPSARSQDAFGDTESGPLHRRQAAHSQAQDGYDEDREDNQATPSSRHTQSLGSYASLRRRLPPESPSRQRIGSDAVQPPTFTSPTRQRIMSEAAFTSPPRQRLSSEFTSPSRRDGPSFSRPTIASASRRHEALPRGPLFVDALAAVARDTIPNIRTSPHRLRQESLRTRERTISEGQVAEFGMTTLNPIQTAPGGYRAAGSGYSASAGSSSRRDYEDRDRAPSRLRALPPRSEASYTSSRPPEGKFATVRERSRVSHTGYSDDEDDEREGSGSNYRYRNRGGSAESALAAQQRSVVGESLKAAGLARERERSREPREDVFRTPATAAVARSRPPTSSGIRSRPPTSMGGVVASQTAPQLRAYRPPSRDSGRPLSRDGGRPPPAPLPFPSVSSSRVQTLSTTPAPDHARLLQDAFKTFEANILRASQSSTLLHADGTLTAADTLVHAASTLNNLLRQSVQHATDEEIDAQIHAESSRDPMADREVDIWRKMGAEFRESVRVSDEIVRTMTAFLLDVGKVMRDASAAPTPARVPTPMRREHSMHFRGVSLDEEALALRREDERARGSADGRASVSSGGRRSLDPNHTTSSGRLSSELRSVDEDARSGSSRRLGPRRSEGNYERSSPSLSANRNLEERERERERIQEYRTSTAQGQEYRSSPAPQEHRNLRPEYQYQSPVSVDGPAPLLPRTDSPQQRPSVLTSLSARRVLQIRRPTSAAGSPAQSSPSGNFPDSISPSPITRNGLDADRHRRFPPLAVAPNLPSESVLERRYTHRSTSSNLGPGIGGANVARRKTATANLAPLSGHMRTGGARFPSLTSPSRPTTQISTTTVSTATERERVFEEEDYEDSPLAQRERRRRTLSTHEAAEDLPPPRFYDDRDGDGSASGGSHTVAVRSGASGRYSAGRFSSVRDSSLSSDGSNRRRSAREIFS